MVGAGIGRALAYGLGIPAVEVHHMEAHLLAPLLADERHHARPALPFVALLVSGGHTQLVHVAAIGRYEILGESVSESEEMTECVVRKILRTVETEISQEGSVR